MTNGIQNTIHALSQILLVPVMVVLLLLAAYAVVELGSLVVEGLSERRRFKAVISRFTRAVSDATPAQVKGVIENSGLLRRQRAALSEIFSMRDMRPDVREALAMRLLAEEEQRYRRTLMRSDFATRVAPMFGLMGTLIPLGPGVMALSSGDMTTLSNSLVVAFDTTVAGLIVSAVAFGISKLRRHWYEGYMSALEAAMNIVLDKVASLTPADTEVADG